jgi:hypothetical protein
MHLQPHCLDETNEVKLHVNLCFFATKCDKVWMAMCLTGLWHVADCTGIYCIFYSCSRIILLA